MKAIYIILLALLGSLGVQAQTAQPDLPAGATRYSQTLWIAPDSTLWTGKTGNYIRVADWHDVDSLFGLGYDKGQVDSAILSKLEDYVPITRTINGKALSADISLTASDVGALSTTGGNLTGPLNMGNNLITNVADPISNGDAVNLNYMENAIVDAIENIPSGFNVGNSAGSTQFNVGLNEQLRFQGGGGTSVSFSPATKTVVISSSGTGGGNQTLALSGNPGGISISDGNEVALPSLAASLRSAFNDKSLGDASGFTTFIWGAGSSGYPMANGSGIYVNRYSSTTSNSGFVIVKPGATSGDYLQYNTWNGNNAYDGWKTIADRDWVTSQIPSIPTNYVTTNTSQSSLSGNKKWLGTHTFPQILVTDGVYSSPGQIALSAPNGFPFITFHNNDGSRRAILSTETDRFEVNTGGLPMRVTGLSGTGTQMVVANAQGTLNRQAIPVVPNNIVTYNTGAYPQIEVGSPYFRTSTGGILPDVQGGTTTAQVGTSSYPFAAVYANTIFEGGTALASKYAPLSRTITAGNGMTGGGSLSGNVAITLGTPSTITGSSTNSVSATSHTHALTLVSGDITGALGFTPVTNARTLTAGDGLTGGGNLTANRTLAVDASVVRTTGTQTIDGVKQFVDVVTVPMPSMDDQVANKEYVDTQIAAAVSGIVKVGTPFSTASPTSMPPAYIVYTNVSVPEAETSDNVIVNVTGNDWRAGMAVSACVNSTGVVGVSITNASSSSIATDGSLSFYISLIK